MTHCFCVSATNTQLSHDESASQMNVTDCKDPCVTPIDQETNKPENTKNMYSTEAWKKNNSKDY